MGPDGGGAGSWIFTAVPIVIGVIGVIVVGGIVFGLVRGAARWSRNNAAPVVTTTALVVTKRQRVSGGGHDTSATTSYYATFELPSGERRELGIRGSEYGVLAEGDTGQLTYQGTRYKGFARGAAIQDRRVP